MAVRLVCTDSETSIEQQDSPISPRSQQTSVIWWCDEVGIVLFDSFVDIDEGGRSASGRADGECQAVSLVVIMVWVLADNDYFHFMQWCVSRPRSVSKLAISRAKSTYQK